MKEEVIVLNKTDEDRIHHPHDKKFKILLSNPKRFLNFLKDCVDMPWVEHLDENMLRKSEKSFILQDFKEKEADIVYEAELNGNKIVMYILLEHQSKVDYRMPYRLLLYQNEIIRDYYNNSEPEIRETKNFKFPPIFSIVLFTVSTEWNVPLQIRDMFENAELFGNYVMNFEYLLLDTKGYTDEDLKKFPSKLLSTIFMLEKSKSDIEFYNSIRNNLEYIKEFDEEERRIFNMCIKIIDIAYSYNKNEDIKKMIEENSITEVDSMLCDVIENAKYEKERLLAEGRLEGKLEGGLEKAVEIAKSLLLEGIPIGIIEKCTHLSKEQIGNIKLN